MLNLSVVSQTNTTVTLGWNPVPDCIGYKFTVDGKVSHTWDGTRTTVRVSKGATNVTVEALGLENKGTWPKEILIQNKRWYTDSSIWNTPISSNPSIHPNNETIINMFSIPWTQGGYGGSGGLMGMSIDWVPTVWEADASTPLVNVRIDYPSYGYATVQVPIPDGAKPALPLVSQGGEGHMMIWRVDTGDAWDFYKARIDNGIWSALKVQKSNLIDGHSSNVLYGDGSQRNSPRASYTASGAGMIRQRDVQSGELDFGHALAVSYKGTLSRGAGGIPVFPALDTDGTGTNPLTDVPMGARFQLDPSINIDTWPSLNSGPSGTPFHRALARTLQKYGMFVIDTNYNGPALVNENYLSLRDGYQWPNGFYEPLPYDLATHFRVIDWRQ